MADNEAYTLRIAQASPAQLVVITFELIVDFIDEALVSPADGFRRLIDKAKRGVMQLVSGLDFSYEQAQTFYDIYIYVYGLLVKAHVTRGHEPAAEARGLLFQLLGGWREAAKQENAEPSPTAPQIYAGLTYRRGGLAEYVVDDESKDFKA